MKWIKILKWTAAHVAWVTMAYSPVALGVEAERLSKQKLAGFIQEFGLNKTTTVGEFWEKTKAYYPGYAYKQIEGFVAQNKNVVMPEVLVSSVTNTDGTEIPVVQFSQNGKTTTIQIYGENSKWAKVNNTVLSALDLQRPDDTFKRVIANDVQIKREADTLQKKIEGARAIRSRIDEIQASDMSRFKGFPRMTPQLWKAMTPQTRVAYIVNMRLMWTSAQKVQDAVLPQHLKTSLDPIFEKLIQSVLGEDAVAAQAAKKKPAFDNVNCIVAGYVGRYDVIKNSKNKDHQVCSIDKAIDGYKASGLLNASDTSFIARANLQCQTEQTVDHVACNPIVYGYPKGKPACVNRTDKSFQTATHYKGACDAQSPLNTLGEPLFKDKDYSNIVPRSKQLEMIDADQRKQNYDLTKQFLEGVLQHKDSALFAAFQKGEWTKELDAELVNIQSAFEDEIGNAIKTCEADIVHKNEPNQKGACDQLHRRWLFTEKFLNPLRQKACPPNSKFVPGATLKDPPVCQCESDENKKVSVGSDPKQCDIPVVVVPGKKEPAPVEDKSCPAGAIFMGDGKCACIAKKEVTFDQLLDPAKAKELCEGKDNTWKWALGIGAGILALFAIFGRNKKKTPQPPPAQPPMCEAGKKSEGGACVCANTCAPGQTQNPASCGCASEPPIPPAQCAAPFVGTVPACACPASNSCTPGQQIYNLSTCQCDNVPQPVICPDGSKAPNNNSAQCPKCSNGSYAPVGGCPVDNEGGTGDNCPTGNCNGGVPTTN